MSSRVTKNKKHLLKYVVPITYTVVFAAATLKVFWVVSFQAKSKKTCGKYFGLFDWISRGRKTK